MWKIIILPTIIVYGFGIFFNFKSYKKLTSYNISDLKKRNGEDGIKIASKEKALNDLKKEVTDYDSDINAEQVKIDALNQKVDLSQNKLNEIKDKVAEKESALGSIQEQLDSLDDSPNDIIKEVARIDSELDVLSTSVIRKKANINSLSKSIISTENKLNKLKSDFSLRTKGELSPDFKASIKNIYPDWGLVVINKGSLGGVAPSGNLVVRKNSVVIAKLKIRTVEERYSVADIVSGSMKSNIGISTGDRVYADTLSSDSNKPLYNNIAKASAIKKDLKTTVKHKGAEIDLPINETYTNINEDNSATSNDQEDNNVNNEIDQKLDSIVDDELKNNDDSEVSDDDIFN